MKQKLNFAPIAIMSVCAVLILAQCAKSFNGSTPNTVINPGPVLPPPPPINIKCPYDCHDTRCKTYLNYCGFTNPTIPVNFQMVPVTNTAISGIMTRAFESLSVNWAAISQAAGLPATIQESDIDFQNLYESHDGSILGGLAISAPLKTNSNSNASNYAFTIYTNDNVCYRSPIFIKSMLNFLQYFDLTAGAVLSVTNYRDSVNYSTSIDSSGSFLTGGAVNSSSGAGALTRTIAAGISNSPNALSGPCGQKTMNCITDAYTNHGWISVWLFVQTAFIPETAAGMAAACAANNCRASTRADQGCYN